jgi:hypothetical protein
MPEHRKPEDVARQAVLSIASDSEEVGELQSQRELENGVSEFRFSSHIQGYEDWLWLVTLYHDEEADNWTVDESSLIPGVNALLPPAWIPWKDRLQPSDLSVTDAFGTDPYDPRLEEGWHASQEDEVGDSDGQLGEEVSDDDAQHGATAHNIRTEDDQTVSKIDDWLQTHKSDIDDIVQEYYLTRRHVLSIQGRNETAERWYRGQHGPKSLSTRTAGGNNCETCGFMIPLQGALGTMFGVCANRWSPDDGRVVSLDHGCGEHSEIMPPDIGNLWVQSEPAFDDLHIDVVHQSKRDEISAVELIEAANNDDSSDDEIDETER